jgi:hypothetical protein
LLHIVPLFPPVGGLDFSDDAIWNHFAQEVQPFGLTNAFAQPVVTLEGLHLSQSVDSLPGSHTTTLLRVGGMEFQQYNLSTHDGPQGGALIDMLYLEKDVLQAFAQTQRLILAGVLAPPFAIGLRLNAVAGLRLGSGIVSPKHLHATKIAEDELVLPTHLVSDISWKAEETAHAMFDVLWQAWGYRRSLHYDDAGVRRSNAL